jgi:hypothetical protein
MLGCCWQEQEQQRWARGRCYQTLQVSGVLQALARASALKGRRWVKAMVWTAGQRRGWAVMEVGARKPWYVQLSADRVGPV